MSQSLESRKEVLIDQNFFCDGHFYVLTSASLGGSTLKPEDISDTLGRGDEVEIEQLLRQGICIPLFFDGDCALDRKTLFVLGKLTPEEEHDWIGRLTWKLNIPCGKLVLLCGGGDADELAYAISGNPPKPNYQISQVIDVVPGEYQVDVYAYLSSMTVQQSLEEYDEHWNLIEHKELETWYQANRPGTSGISYIVRLAPLESEPPLPKLVPEMGWCGEFEFRKTEV
ncbi:MAG: hypothetical protein NW224_22125 [Leptolyngbyaceae cyanobacterium bins.302]|nr:hypothetical protein [Leptolyngbyaceae cyanobacterium bins.302]